MTQRESELPLMIRRLERLMATQDHPGVDYSPPTALREVPSISSDNASGNDVNLHAELEGSPKRNFSGASEG